MTLTPPLRLARAVWNTEAEGPGVRAAFWVQGCSLRCPGCCNPEMFAPRGGRDLALCDLTAELARAAAAENASLEGISLLGGEPFEQAEACAALARAARDIGLSVMTFTGYTRQELAGRPDAQPLVDATDLLVAGRYDQSLPDRQRRWVGSTNQELVALTKRYDIRSDPRFAERNTLELRLRNGTLTVNGWPKAADALRPRGSS